MLGMREEEIDRHLQLFLRLKSPHFYGIVDPRAAEDWLLKLEKSFNSMQCPEGTKVSLAIFFLMEKLNASA